MCLKNSFSALLTFLFCVFEVSAQDKAYSSFKHLEMERKFHSASCGFDYYHEKKLKNDKNYIERYQQTLSNIKKAQNLSYRMASGVYQVPVVVHVMHKGENIGEGSNISDSDVRTGIEYLNNYWRKISGTQGDGDGVDMEIEFALAVRDDNGNCTDGIVRKDMSQVSSYVSDGVGDYGLPDYDGDGQTNSLKEYSIWNPNKYYNVWLVDKIDGNNCSSDGYTAGYAYYASEHGQLWDGSVVLICSYLDEFDDTWAHEMGHALNLPHTFDGDDDNPGSNYQCGDDGIDDTPKHIRTMFIDDLYYDCDNADVNHCDPNFNVQMSPSHTGNGTHQDHMRNYMDYTGCSSEFTWGQKAVAKSALINERASLLFQNGNQSLVPISKAEIDFSSSTTVTCVGSTIEFTDLSSCIPNSYTNEPIQGIDFNWIFDNGIHEAYVSTEQNPEINFEHAGIYNVTLEVRNSHGLSRLTKSDWITVTENALDACSASSQNSNTDYSCGVTNISFNDLNHTTSTFIPENSMQDFTCLKSTVIEKDSTYLLTIAYQSDNFDSQYLEVWLDWDGDGAFEISNNNSDNERLLSHHISTSVMDTVSVVVVPPSSTTLNKLLRMRVVSDSRYVPEVCGKGLSQRADDYGVIVRREVIGCKDSSACNYNEEATTEGLCTYPIETYLDCLGACINDADGDRVCDELEVLGCTDSNACNYNENATNDDGFCYHTISATIEPYAYDHELVKLVVYPNVEVSYEWYLGETLLPEFTSNEMIPAVNGNYSVFVKANDKSGCFQTNYFIIETLNLYDELDDLGIVLYPNPTSDKLYLVVNDSYEVLQIEFIDVTGAVVSVHTSKKYEVDEVHELDVSNFQVGYYLLRVVSENKQKIIPWTKYE